MALFPTDASSRVIQVALLRQRREEQRISGRGEVKERGIVFPNLAPINRNRAKLGGRTERGGEQERKGEGGRVRIWSPVPG